MSLDRAPQSSGGNERERNDYHFGSWVCLQANRSFELRKFYGLYQLRELALSAMRTNMIKCKLLGLLSSQNASLHCASDGL